MILLGEYDLTKDKLQNNTGFLPPKSAPRFISENRGRQIDNAPNISRRSGIPHGRIGSYVGLGPPMH